MIAGVFVFGPGESVPARPAKTILCKTERVLSTIGASTSIGVGAV